MASIPPGYSSRLYNEDIAPRTGEGTWKTWNLFAWWMSCWHSLAGYTMAIGLLVLGLTGWQMALGLSLGVVVIYFASNLMGIAGQKVGVPFPVFSRASFGVFGANIPALLRAIVAVAWYGIQTYLASAAMMILVLKVLPGSKALTESSFLGLSGLGWICFLVLWTAQLVVLHRGMETVRRLSDFAGPSIWVAMIALAVWTLIRADWTLDWNYHVGAEPLSFSSSIIPVLSAVSLTCGFMAGPMLNFADFTRFSPDKKSVVNGNRLGLLLNGVAFCLVSVVIALASVKVYGKAVSDPIELIGDIDSVSILLVAIITIGIATVGINIIANFVSPSYGFANVMPKYISFRTGGIITALLALLVMPWNLYSNPVVINLFIGGVGALMGPIFGIMMVDYYLIRRAQVNPDSLYSDAPNGRYFYSRGTNLNSVIAMAISGIVTLCIALIPVFGTLATFSWPIGVALGGISCLVINRLRPNVHARAADLSVEASDLLVSANKA